MPAFTKLSTAQIDAIVGHVRGWPGKPAPEFPASPVKGTAHKGKR